MSDAEKTALIRAYNLSVLAIVHNYSSSVPAELEDNPRHPFSGAFSYPDLARVSDHRIAG